jgi:uncharacterized protein YcfJ
MNTRLHSRPLSRLLCAALAGSAAAMFATPLLAESRFDYAEVIDSTPIYRTVEVSVPREECWTEEVVSQRRAHSHSSTPAILGTIIGGALGNAVGHDKSNKRVGAVVGAVLGHSIGRDIVAANSRGRVTEVETVRQCETVYDHHEEERLLGYQVRYRYHDKDYSVRMDDDPGEFVRVRVDVQPVFQ